MVGKAPPPIPLPRKERRETVRSLKTVPTFTFIRGEGGTTSGSLAVQTLSQVCRTFRSSLGSGTMSGQFQYLTKHAAPLLPTLQNMITAPTFSTSRNEIAGLSVIELAREYGTPLYVYDQSVIDQRITDLASFDVIRYAQKACGNLAILDRMRRQGVVVDAVSAGKSVERLPPAIRPTPKNTKLSTQPTFSTAKLSIW